MTVPDLNVQSSDAIQIVEPNYSVGGIGHGQTGSGIGGVAVLISDYYVDPFNGLAVFDAITGDVPYLGAWNIRMPCPPCVKAGASAYAAGWSATFPGTTGLINFVNPGSGPCSTVGHPVGTTQITKTCRSIGPFYMFYNQLQGMCSTALGVGVTPNQCLYANYKGQVVPGDANTPISYLYYDTASGDMVYTIQDNGATNSTYEGTSFSGLGVTNFMCAKYKLALGSWNWCNTNVMTLDASCGCPNCGTNMTYDWAGSVYPSDCSPSGGSFTECCQTNCSQSIQSPTFCCVLPSFVTLQPITPCYCNSTDQIPNCITTPTPNSADVTDISRYRWATNTHPTTFCLGPVTACDETLTLVPNVIDPAAATYSATAMDGRTFTLSSIAVACAGSDFYTAAATHPGYPDDDGSGGSAIGIENRGGVPIRSWAGLWLGYQWQLVIQAPNAGPSCTLLPISTYLGTKYSGTTGCDTGTFSTTTPDGVSAQSLLFDTSGCDALCKGIGTRYIVAQNSNSTSTTTTACNSLIGQAGCKKINKADSITLSDTVSVAVQPPAP